MPLNLARFLNDPRLYHLLLYCNRSSLMYTTSTEYSLRYGFHGTSHEYVVGELHKRLGKGILYVELLDVERILIRIEGCELSSRCRMQCCCQCDRRTGVKRHQHGIHSSIRSHDGDKVLIQSFNFVFHRNSFYRSGNVDPTIIPYVAERFV